jgi:hypothetical protein
MVFQGRPKNLQDIALGRFNAARDLEAAKTGGFGNHLAQAPINCRFEVGLLPWVNPNVCNLEYQNPSPYEGLLGVTTRTLRTRIVTSFAADAAPKPSPGAFEAQFGGSTIQNPQVANRPQLPTLDSF